MIEWQMIDPTQELTTRNGSAILSIARELREAAERTGVEALIVGGSIGQPDLPGCLRILRASPPTNFLAQLLDKAIRYLVGSPLRPTLAFEATDAPPPQALVLHNLPWAGKELRRRFPTAHMTLYVHNKILNGVPKRTARRVLGHFDQIVCVSDFIREDLLSRSGSITTKSLRFRTILNAKRSDLEFHDAPLKYDVVYVGRLVREKGVHVVTSGASLPGRRWSMAIVGGKYFLPGHEADPYVQSLRAQATQKSLDIEFTGPVSPPDVLAYLGSARVVVVPSIWDEPGALALLEAMASPAAVVASRVGGLPEMSRQGGVAFVDPDSPAQLRNAVDFLLSDEPERMRVASAGQREVAKWTWDDVYERLKEN